MLRKFLPILFTVLISSNVFATATMPPVAAAYPAPSTQQMYVARAYFMLFGRIPDTSGLNYWVSRVAANNGTTFIDTVNVISREAAGARLAPIVGYVDSTGTVTDPNIGTCSTSTPGPWDELVEYVYANALGRAAEDENLASSTEGIRYWQCQARFGAYGKNTGQMLDAISNSAASDPIYSNRLVFLEAAVRLQLGRGRSLNYHDSNTILVRVRGTNNSFNDAFDVLNQLTNGMPVSANVHWEIPTSGAYTRSNISTNSSPLPRLEKSIDDGLTSISGGSVHKYLVWYNRSGRMMLAHAFLPQNYQLSGVYYPTIVSVFGGAWRGGLIEKLQRFNTSFIRTTPLAGGTAGNNFIVLAPSYRLTSNLYYSSTDSAKNNMPQEDIDDFISLVKRPETMTMLGVDTSKVSLFGHSSGGHILNLLGSTKNMGRIATLAPVSNLAITNNTNTSALIPYINYYTDAQQYGTWGGTTSPINAWLLNKPLTSFFIQHGTDQLVYQAQSKAFRDQAISNNSNNVQACNSNSGHIFFESYSDPNVNNAIYKTTAFRAFQYLSGITPVCTSL
ncbi:prolyl oligopeptidase family serine peptidase [Undibacterium flavidum]|uniref:DUF4214 domain-containing protein n=1 Tax=Undibacterium flavidum TaxID=2762297 RepID=A0ABR6Y9C1_9BURK|nr:prolyl oligopeptidase family serine peptidase [Undibacterium flavidum]MBC3873150.1 DUF4214 domain-containing protein [Undibacterium flavidum]